MRARAVAIRRAGLFANQDRVNRGGGGVLLGCRIGLFDCTPWHRCLSSVASICRMLCHSCEAIHASGWGTAKFTMLQMKAIRLAASDLSMSHSEEAAREEDPRIHMRTHRLLFCKSPHPRRFPLAPTCILTHTHTRIQTNTHTHARSRYHSRPSSQRLTTAERQRAPRAGLPRGGEGPLGTRSVGPLGPERAPGGPGRPGTAPRPPRGSGGR